MMKYLKSLIIVGACFVFALGRAQGEGSDLSDRKSNYDKAVAFFQANEFDPAIDRFQKALGDGYGPAAQSRIYNLIGLCYLKQGVSIPSAIGSFEQSIRLDPNFAEPYFNIASTYASGGAQNEKAVEYFKKTIEVDPQFYKAYFGMGWFTLMQAHDPASAIDYFNKTLEHFPDFSEAQYGIGMAYLQLNQPHMALGAVSQLRSLQRDDLAATLERAITEMSPPGEVVPAPVMKQPEAPVQPAQQSTAQISGSGPVEVVIKGKLVPLPEEDSGSAPK